jgi:hypothetical protein
VLDQPMVAPENRILILGSYKSQIPNLWLQIITNWLLICETILTPTFLLGGVRVSNQYIFMIDSLDIELYIHEYGKP